MIRLHSRIKECHPVFTFYKLKSTRLNLNHCSNRSISASGMSFHLKLDCIRLRQSSESHVVFLFFFSFAATETSPFDELILRRQSEARRSIVVHVQSENSYNDLYQYCSQFGPVSNAFHYRCAFGKHRIVVEYEAEASATEALKKSVFDGPHIPAISRFLWFRASKTKLLVSIPDIPAPPLAAIDGTQAVTPETLKETLLKQNNINEQINELYQHTRINELGTRLRFLAALQIEDSVKGIFPQARVFPFGSSVNGFGKFGSDLDVILHRSSIYKDSSADDRRLCFHTRADEVNDRSVEQRQLQVMNEILCNILPGIVQVNAIMFARVPIIKFEHQFLGLEVDLSTSNL